MPVYAFGPFVLDVAERRVARDGEPVSMAGRVFQILHMLVEAQGRLVERDRFFQRLWPDVTVEERNLTVHISTLRRLLGKGPTPHGYIETVTKAGYRLAVPVRLLRDGEASSTGARPAARPDKTDRPIAVLPFADQGTGASDSLLGAGMAGALIAQLGAVPGLVVRPAGAVRGMAPRQDPIDVGRALGVGHVLSGTVQRGPRQLSVRTQLIDTDTGATRWSERFEHPANDPAALQDAIAARVARWFEAQPAQSESLLGESYRPRGDEAYFLQLQARGHLQRAERVPALKALALFEQALAIDPDYPVAHAGLAATYLLLTSTMIRRPLPVDEAVGLARASAERALALDETLAEAWAVLGRLKMFYQWDWPGAEADLAHGVALSPNSVEAVEAYGWFLAAAGRHDEAVGTLARAHRLDPMRRETLEHLGLAQWMAGDGARAVDTLATAAFVDPKARRPHFRRMFVLDQLGRHDDAMAERIAWLELFDDAPMAARFAELRRAGQWRTAMVEWIARLGGLNQWFECAIQSMAIGDSAAALDRLERCVAERSTGAPFLLQYPSFRPLQPEPRFQRLAREIGLAA